MYMPVIEDERCTRCRACAHICPKGVFDEDEDDLRVNDPVYCTGCESCTAVCPIAAIKVEEL